MPVEPVASRVLRQELRYALQLVALCGFVFAKPVLDAFGASPETFLAVEASARTILLFGLFWVFVPPLALWLVAAPTRLIGERTREWTHLLTLVALVTLFVVQALTQSRSWGSTVVWAVAVAGGIAAGWLWRRFSTVRDFATVLAGAPFLFLALFLFSSPVSAIFGGSPEPAAASGGSNTPIVFIVFDEFPTASLLDAAGHIDPAMYPAFARLASTSTWYRNNTTVASETGRAVPAILSGKYAPTHPTAPVLANYPQNLFTMLGSRYTFHVEQTLTSLCPDRLCQGRNDGGGIRNLVGPSLDLWTDRFHRTAPQGDGIVASLPDRGGSFERFAADVGSTRGPRLDFVHALLPHVTWDYLASGRTYDEGSDNGITYDTYAWMSGEAARVGRERHVEQLRYTDHLLGELLDRLEARGRFDDSLVVVTADHGVSFSNRQPLRATTPKNLTEIAWSPLFIKRPGQRTGTVDDRNAESIDILPTVADVIGAKLRNPVDGRSLLGPPRRTGTKQLEPYPQNSAPTDPQGRIVIDGARGFRQLLAMPPGFRGGDALAAMRTGPYHDVVGRRAEDVTHAGAVDGKVSLDTPTIPFDPAERTVASLVRGTVEGRSEPTVALLVDGVIAGTCAPDPQHRVRFLVPEDLLHDGTNDLSLVALDGPADAPVLHAFSGH